MPCRPVRSDAAEEAPLMLMFFMFRRLSPAIRRRLQFTGATAARRVPRAPRCHMITYVTLFIAHAWLRGARGYALFMRDIVRATCFNQHRAEPEPPRFIAMSRDVLKERRRRCRPSTGISAKAGDRQRGEPEPSSSPLYAWRERA